MSSIRGSTVQANLRKYKTSVIVKYQSPCRNVCVPRSELDTVVTQSTISRGLSDDSCSVEHALEVLVAVILGSRKIIIKHNNIIVHGYCDQLLVIHILYTCNVHVQGGNYVHVNI